MNDFQLKMMNGDVFEISQEEVSVLLGKTGLILISRINTLINLSSVCSISPAGTAKTKSDYNKIICKDGTIAINKFGIWYDEYSVSKLNLDYYPELKTNLSPSQIAEIEEGKKQIGNI